MTPSILKIRMKKLELALKTVGVVQTASVQSYRTSGTKPLQEIFGAQFLMAFVWELFLTEKLFRKKNKFETWSRRETFPCWKRKGKQNCSGLVHNAGQDTRVAGSDLVPT